MQTEIHAAYKAAHELLQELYYLDTLRKYADNAEQVTEQAVAVRKYGFELWYTFKPIYELMEYCYLTVGSCQFPPHDNWVAATLTSVSKWQTEAVFRNKPLASPEQDGLLYQNINRRLLLEKSVLLRECPQYLATLPQPEQGAPVPDTQLPSKPEQPQPKRYRRKPDVPAVKTAEEIAFGFLLLWHEYDTKTFHCDPIPPMTKFVLWMTEKNAGKPGPSTSAVSRMLKDKFADKEKNNGHAKYLNACGNGTLEKKLALGKGEANRVFQERQQRERSTTDPELDLD